MMYATANKPPKLVRRMYYADRDRYWDMIELTRTPDGLCDWFSDFISIHKCRRGGDYSLLAPLCMIEHRNWRRPRFERRRFKTFKSAQAYALKMARRSRSLGLRIHVVNCH